MIPCLFLSSFSFFLRTGHSFDLADNLNEGRNPKRTCKKEGKKHISRHFVKIVACSTFQFYSSSALTKKLKTMIKHPGLGSRIVLVFFELITRTRLCPGSQKENVRKKKKSSGILRRLSCALLFQFHFSWALTKTATTMMRQPGLSF